MQGRGRRFASMIGNNGYNAPVVPQSVPQQTRQRARNPTPASSMDGGRKVSPMSAAHRSAVEDRERRNGGREITADSEYPLTPGTEPAGTRECWDCGTHLPDRHLAPACTHVEKVPWMERQYRMKFALRKIRDGNLQLGTGSIAVPVSNQRFCRAGKWSIRLRLTAPPLLRDLAQAMCSCYSRQS
jgi:hypothetical protein